MLKERKHQHSSLYLVLINFSGQNFADDIWFGILTEFQQKYRQNSDKNSRWFQLIIVILYVINEIVWRRFTRVASVLEVKVYN